jgi:hypothetical protein
MLAGEVRQAGGRGEPEIRFFAALSSFCAASRLHFLF